jgi:hypothetical protein
MTTRVLRHRSSRAKSSTPTDHFRRLTGATTVCLRRRSHGAPDAKAQREHEDVAAPSEPVMAFQALCVDARFGQGRLSARAWRELLPLLRLIRRAICFAREDLCAACPLRLRARFVWILRLMIQSSPSWQREDEAGRRNSSRSSMWRREKIGFGSHKPDRGGVKSGDASNQAVDL